MPIKTDEKYKVCYTAMSARGRQSIVLNFASGFLMSLTPTKTRYDGTFPTDWIYQTGGHELC
jgi:hypothetical protein